MTSEEHQPETLQEVWRSCAVCIPQ